MKFDHVTIRVSDPAESERFYDTVLAALGGAGEFGDGCAEFAEWDDFSIAGADAEHPPTTGLHVGFRASSRDDVDRFWHAGTAAGFRSDGEPGPRPQYRDDYYGAFLLDPDGNSIEAVHHGDVGHDGNIDHLWIRVDDLDAATAFYDQVAEYTRFPKLWIHDDRVHFGAMGSHFALVADRPLMQNIHVAFSAARNETVDAFHTAAVAAGYTSNGEPGERPQYHPGYYAAFVFDPAGANVEVVNHNR